MLGERYRAEDDEVKKRDEISVSACVYNDKRYFVGEAKKVSEINLTSSPLFSELSIILRKNKLKKTRRVKMNESGRRSWRGGEQSWRLPQGLIGRWSSPNSTNFIMLAAFLVIFQLLASAETVYGQHYQPSGGEPSDTWNTADYYKREHSLSKPYQGAGWQIPNWDFQGTTIVTNQYIRLTPDVRSQQGSLWNAAPVRMHNWEVQLQVKVHGRGKDLFGDGLVFWYARDRMIPGPVFGSKDYFMGLAVIIDTYSNHNGPHNHQHPYISAMINNGTLHYDHDRDGTHTQLAGCEAKLRNVEQDSWLSVKYEGDILTVSTDMVGRNSWQPCLKVEGVKLPTGYFFGLSAATGDLSDNHDVITIKTYELETGGVPPEDDHSKDSILPSAVTYESQREHVDDPKPGWSGIKIFFVTLFSILGVIAIGVIGIIVYQNHQQNSRKRFY